MTCFRKDVFFIWASEKLEIGVIPLVKRSLASWSTFYTNGLSGRIKICRAFDCDESVLPIRTGWFLEMTLKKTDSLTGVTVFTDSHTEASFAETLIAWQKRHGRHCLPWQNTRNAYRIWLSEIMLQQTQVATVIPYYNRFLDSFPTVFSLAAASLDEVMKHWSGLGYYTRARNLHRCAQMVVSDYSGVFPSDPALLEKLPGIGKSTAAAIAVFSAGVKAAILDGNVVRVFSRVFGLTDSPAEKEGKDRLWDRAYDLLPDTDLEAYTQGLMDLGATVCVRSSPACIRCPFSSRCVALAENRITDLPVRKGKKTVPVKSVVMLVLQWEDRVLLEKRPEAGIWGGLYSLPEWGIDGGNPGLTDEDTLNSLKDSIAAFGIFRSWEFREPFIHVFSHFRLHITPCVVDLKEPLAEVGGAVYVWHDMEQLDDVPLPAPVRKLLNESSRQKMLKWTD